MNRIFQLTLIGIVFCCVVANAQTPDSKNFAKDGLSFDYPAAWQLKEETNGDAQQLTLAKADSDVQIRVFVHKGRVTAEKLPDAKRAFIDPYIASTTKQFIELGAKPEQAADSSEIGGVKAEGTIVSASLGGEAGAAKIYWALVGQRVVVLTIFGPDKQMKQLTPAWDLVRTSLKIVDPKAVPAASPKAVP